MSDYSYKRHAIPNGARRYTCARVRAHSVTVRVNDRGPFIRGRTVDVFSSAAEALQ